MIKKIFFCIIALFGMSFFYGIAAATSKTDTAKLDKIVAIVNSDVITQSELDKKITIFKQQDSSGIKDSALRTLVLNKLIDELLQLQVARRNGIKISDKEIDHAIANVIKNNRITLEQLKKDLQEHVGLSMKQYREQISNQLLLSQVRAPLLREVSVSEGEISSCLRNPPKMTNALTKYHVMDVLIETPGASTHSQTVADVAAELRRGVAAEKIVHKYETSGKQVSSSDLGWRKIDELPSLFAEKILVMKVGQVSDPLHAPNGVHIIKLLEMANGQKLTQEQARELIYSKKADAQLKPWIKELRESSYVQIIK